MIGEYFELRKKVHDYFGYKEDWVNIPLEDLRNHYWKLAGEAYGSGQVFYYEEPLTQDVIDNGDYFTASIYTQRFLPKWVYRGKDYTLICMDPHVDGNRFLGIFTNEKETKDA